MNGCQHTIGQLAAAAAAAAAALCYAMTNAVVVYAVRIFSLDTLSVAQSSSHACVFRRLLSAPWCIYVIHAATVAGCIVSRHSAAHLSECQTTGDECAAVRRSLSNNISSALSLAGCSVITRADVLTGVSRAFIGSVRMCVCVCVHSHTKITGHIITKLGRWIVHNKSWSSISFEMKRLNVKVTGSVSVMLRPPPRLISIR